MSSSTTTVLQPHLTMKGEDVTRSVHGVRHVMAQSLNNRATRLLAMERYDDAIDDLTQALELAKSDISANRGLHVCTCRWCSLETCLMTMVHSPLVDEFPTTRQLDSSNDNDETDLANQTTTTIDTVSSADEWDQNSMDLDDDSDNDGIMNASKSQQHLFVKQNVIDTTYESSRVYEEGYVYCKPLLIHPKCIEERHYMGVTLSMVILFNISLVYHLKAIQTFKNSSSSNQEKTKALARALQLYELVYELHSSTSHQHAIHEQAGDEKRIPYHLVSLRFTMLITNNLGEIHRLANNSQKHNMCLRHLISAMMYMFHNCESTILKEEELNGFYQNLSPILGTKRCAAAA